MKDTDYTALSLLELDTMEQRIKDERERRARETQKKKDREVVSRALIIWCDKYNESIEVFESSNRKTGFCEFSNFSIPGEIHI